MMGLARNVKIFIFCSLILIICYLHIGTITQIKKEFDWSNYTNIPFSGYSFPKTYDATYNLSKTPVYAVTDDVKTWFGHNLSFPQTLDTDFVINPSALCPRDTWLDYLLVVKSAPSNFLRRQFIRATFGRRDLFGHLTQRLVFLLGMREDKDDEAGRNFTEQFRKENDTFNDIIQGPFIDSYRNLTLKGVMGLRWMSLHCHKVKVVVHIDDDVFFNIFRFVTSWLPKLSTKNRLIACSYTPKDNKPIERNQTRWIVRESEFRNLTHYPFNHCNGFFVMIPGHMVRHMLSAATVNPTFWIDDIYLYGMLPHTIGDVQFVWSGMTFKFEKMIKCINDEGVNCDMVFCEFRWGGFDKQWVHLRARLWTSLISNLTQIQRSELHFNEFISFTNVPASK